ncbi:MAG: hypothetical protein K2X55_21740 [Burkholderiaceae bacterium]|nr:hypothetical protein [Burkholderiaceae bacterium]
MIFPVRFAAIAAAAFATLQLTGCAQLAMTPPKANIETTARLRGAAMAPANVGSFTLDAGKPESLDKSISLRGANSVSSPINGSFAQYLRESLKVELEAAGLLDPASATVITGKLTAAEVDAGMGTGKGQLGARFTVMRGNAVRFDRELKVESTWESSFVGAVAIPAAAGNYEALYRKLVANLLDDPAFRKALARE